MVNVGSVRNSTMQQTRKKNTFNNNGGGGGWSGTTEVCISTPEKKHSPHSSRNKNQKVTKGEFLSKVEECSKGTGQHSARPSSAKAGTNRIQSAPSHETKMRNKKGAAVTLVNGGK